MITRKSWQEFREIGLLWWVNTILHMFGWAICFDFNDNGELNEVYPARVKFRGFGEKQVEEGYRKISQYLKENIETLHKESLD